MSWKSRRTLKILVKLRFLPFNTSPWYWNLQISCLIKEIPFPFILITCHVIFHASKIFHTLGSSLILRIAMTTIVWLKWYHMLTFCLKGWKSKVVNVFISVHAWFICLWVTLAIVTLISLDFFIYLFIFLAVFLIGRCKKIVASKCFVRFWFSCTNSTWARLSVENF